jgi:hypothetical protein
MYRQWSYVLRTEDAPKPEFIILTYYGLPGPLTLGTPVTRLTLTREPLCDQNPFDWDEPIYSCRAGDGGLVAAAEDCPDRELIADLRGLRVLSPAVLSEMPRSRLTCWWWSSPPQEAK